MSADHDHDRDYDRDYWLVEPDDQDLAACYAFAANEAESAIRTVMQLADHLEPVPGENARVDDLHHHAEYFGDLWKELRERERELADSDDEIFVPDGADVDRLLAQSEAERLPEGYEHTPMPSLYLNRDAMAIEFAPHPLRTVKHPRHGTASNYLQRVTGVSEAGQFDLSSFDSVSINAQCREAVSPGEIYAVGYKRHERDRGREFYRVTTNRLDEISEHEAKMQLAGQRGDR